MPRTNMEPIQSFFASFYGFEYDSSASTSAEWRRLQRFYRWPSVKEQEKHKARDNARKRYSRAMTEVFNNTFGADEQDIEAWHLLCTAAGITNIPETLAERKQVMLATHVNLCDLMETANKGTRIKVFKRVEDLRAYTLSHGKVFPRGDAYTGGLLRFLLREITGEYHGRHRAPRSSRR